MMCLRSVSLFALVCHALADNQHQLLPTAVRKLSPDSGEKILSEHLAFAPLLSVDISVESLTSFFEQRHDDTLDGNNLIQFYPAFMRHMDEGEDSILRRAAQALALLEQRSACPSNMNSCDDSGSANKCCQQGTFCTSVPDADVGHIACCPNGSTCGGGVGQCPSGATSCEAALGGGCCIPGYVCQGVGCVPSASATQSTGQPPVPTVSKTVQITTVTTSEVASTSSPSGSNIGSATGAPPWRPTGPSAVTSAAASTVTQSGCPTGFYGCLARHGGGCCRTDRDCQTYSCPAPSSTTIVSNGATIVVPVTDLPEPTASATCADGWFICGKDAGPFAGCCPSGYECGTASCFTAGPTETGTVQKQAPKKSSAMKLGDVPTFVVATASLLMMLF